MSWQLKKKDFVNSQSGTLFLFVLQINKIKCRRNKVKTMLNFAQVLKNNKALYSGIDLEQETTLNI